MADEDAVDERALDESRLAAVLDRDARSMASLKAGRPAEALKIALQDPPLASKDEAIKVCSIAAATAHHHGDRLRRIVPTQHVLTASHVCQQRHNHGMCHDRLFCPMLSAGTQRSCGDACYQRGRCQRRLDGLVLGRNEP